MQRHEPSRVLSELLPAVIIDGEDVRRPLDQRMKDYGCSGISVAVIEDGALAWTKGFGTLGRDDSRPVDVETIFMGASISKPLTAALVMKLSEQGVFDLDADVNTYLKSWRLPENEFTCKTPPTLRLLLSHKAGATVHGFGGAPPSAPIMSLVDVLEGRSQTPPVVIDKEPGGATRYSGGGYTVAQLALEEATGRAFAELAEEHIFAPLGMSHTTFHQPPASPLMKNAAIGHYESSQPLEEGFLHVTEQAAGGVWTTASDYAKFLIATRNAYCGFSSDFMRQDTARDMLTRLDPDQGVGWRLLGERERLRFEHGGSNNGFQCEATCYLESGQGAVVMTNGAGGLLFYWEILNTIGDAYEWPNFPLPPKRIQSLTQGDADKYVGDYEILSGIEAPLMKVRFNGETLTSEVPGMRGGVMPALVDQNGNLFNRYFPYETKVEFGPDGRARDFTVLEAGETPIMRARRVS